jgi:TonB family protein
LCEVKNGRFAFYHANGVLQSSGKYIQNKKEGLWKSFQNNGLMADSTVYSTGKQIGKSLSWYPNGYPRDSTALNADRSGVHVSWFDNGFPAAAGRYSSDMKQNGKWKYFHRNGMVSSIEIYEESRLINKQYFNEKGEMLNDTTNTDRPAQFIGGKEAWLKFVSKQIYFPDGYKIVNADGVKVVVTFTVNENGEIENVFTSVPFEKMFDEIAEKAIRKSPKWIPAIEHNRKVKQEFQQPVNFHNYKD